MKKEKLKALAQTKRKAKVIKVPKAKSKPKKSKKAKPYRDYTEVERQLRIPSRTINSLKTIEEVKKAFSLPVSLGTTAENRQAIDMAFDSMGGFDAILGSLQQHAFDMGEYPLTSFLGYGALQQISQNGMIRTCIQTVADDVTREWIEIEGGDDSDPEIVEKLEDLENSKYHLKQIFNEGVAKVGFMGGAFIHIDTGQDDCSLPLIVSDISSELEQGRTVRFVVVDPVNVTPGEYNSTDPLRPDFMQPKYWWVLGKRVHRSRLIPLVDNPPPDLLKPSYNFLGIPQAQILWDYVLHWNQCRVYTADLLKKISLLVMKTDTDAIFGQADGVRNFDIRMKALQRYRDNDSVFVCDGTEEDVMNVQTSVTGCTDIVKQSLEFVVAMNRTPAVKLLGISPSGFSTGDTDLRNYNDHILSKQELRRSAIQTCLNVIQLVEFGTIDESITFSFKELGTNDELNQSQTARNRVETLAALADRQVINAEEYRQYVKNDPTMGLAFLSDELPEGELQDFKTDEFGGLAGIFGNKQKDGNDDSNEDQNGSSD